MCVCVRVCVSVCSLKVSVSDDGENNEATRNSSPRDEQWRPEYGALVDHIAQNVQYDSVLYNFFHEDRYCYCTD